MRRASFTLSLAAVAALSTVLIAQTSVSEPADDPARTVFLFVQSASSGSLAPVEGEAGRYTLTLRGVSPKTIYFSDRPERIAGQAEISAFLEGLGFDPENPPNAALEILGAADSGGVAVVELRDPLWDAATASLTYDVRLLTDAEGDGTAFFSARAGEELSAEFGEAALFIDDCADGQAFCFAEVDYSKGYADPKGSALGSVSFGQCWEWAILKCFMCEHEPQRIGQRCHDKFGARCGEKCRGCVPRTTGTGGGGAIVTYDCY